MQSVTPSIAERNRQTNATVLVARHLIDRAGRHIHAKQTNGRLAWLVESQVTPGKYYTVIRISDGWPVDGCDCEDSSYRHAKGGCKHLRAVNDLAPAAPVVTPQPAPAEFAPAGGWLRDNVKKQRHQVQEEV